MLEDDDWRWEEVNDIQLRLDTFGNQALVETRSALGISIEGLEDDIEVLTGFYNSGKVDLLLSGCSFGLDNSWTGGLVCLDLYATMK